MIFYYLQQSGKWIAIIIFAIGVVTITNFNMWRSGSSATQRRDLQMQQRQQELAQQRAQVVEANLDEAIGLISESKSNLEGGLAQIDLWQMEIEPLPKNDQGELIAQHEELVEDIAYLFHQNRPSRGDLLSRMKQLEEIETSLSSGAVVDGISSRELEEIRDLHQFSAESKLQWENAVSYAQALVRYSSRPPPKAIVESGTAQPASTAESPLMERMEVARDKMLMAQLDQWREREEERQRVLFEAKTEQILLEQEAAEKQRQLIEEAHSAEVQSALSIFLQERLVQPTRSGAAIRMRRTAQKQPMSLGALASTGALRANGEWTQDVGQAGYRPRSARTSLALWQRAGQLVR